MNLTDERLKKLTNDLMEANKAATEAIRGMKDGGTANLDRVFLRIPRIPEAKVLEAIRAAGLYCSGKRMWISLGYMITPTNVGQGDTRTKAVTVMYQHLEKCGWDAIPFRKMD